MTVVDFVYLIALIACPVIWWLTPVPKREPLNWRGRADTPSPSVGVGASSLAPYVPRQLSGAPDGISRARSPRPPLTGDGAGAHPWTIL